MGEEGGEKAAVENEGDGASSPKNRVARKSIRGKKKVIEIAKKGAANVVLPKAPEQTNRGTRIVNGMNPRDMKSLRELPSKIAELDRQLGAFRA